MGKARLGKKEENRKKRVLALEDEELRTTANLMAKNDNNTPRTRHGQNTKKDIHNEINSIQSISTYSFLSSSVLLSSLVNRNLIHIHIPTYISNGSSREQTVNNQILPLI